MYPNPRVDCRHSCNPAPTSSTIVDLYQPDTVIPIRYVVTQNSSCYHCRLLLSSCLRSSKSFFRLYPLSTPLHHCRPPWHSCGSSGNASSSNTLPSEPLALRFFFFHPGLLPLSVAPLALFGPLVLVNVRAACPVQSSWNRLLLVVWPLAYSGLLPLLRLLRLLYSSSVASCDLFSCGLLPVAPSWRLCCFRSPLAILASCGLLPLSLITLLRSPLAIILLWPLASCCCRAACPYLLFRASCSCCSLMETCCHPAVLLPSGCRSYYEDLLLRILDTRNVVPIDPPVVEDTSILRSKKSSRNSCRHSSSSHTAHSNSFETRGPGAPPLSR